jgi:hypothetical protein
MCWTRRDDCNRHCDDMAKAFCNVTVTLAPFYLTLATLGWGTHDITLSALAAPGWGTRAKCNRHCDIMVENKRQTGGSAFSR